MWVVGVSGSLVVRSSLVLAKVLPWFVGAVFVDLLVMGWRIFVIARRAG